MSKIDKHSEAIEHLEKYCGNNPFLLELRNNIIFNGKINQLTDFNIEYINTNYQKEPLLINKTVKIAKWFGDRLHIDYNLDFIPEKIKIKYYLGETENVYHLLIKFRQNMEYEYMFIPKKAILNNFFVQDYNNINVDFERYTNLSNIRKPNSNRILKPHQEESVKFLLSRKKAILALDMGLGKSAALSVASIEGNFDSVLIICPASLKINWFEELSYYIHPREISIIGGFVGMKKGEIERYLGYGEGKSGKTLKELQNEAKETGKWKENRYVIVNFDILDEFFKFPMSRKKEDLEKSFQESQLLQFISGKKSLIIIDEAHVLSNMKSQQYKIINSLIKRGNPDSVYLSTGTPITNNPQNYYCLLNLIDCEITKDWRYYIEHYCDGFKMPINDSEKAKKNIISQNFIKEKKKSNWYELTENEKEELNNILNREVKFRWIPKGASNLDELKERTKHIYLRRTKEELNSTLPQKFVYEKIYELTDDEKVEYDKLWDEYQKENEGKELNKELLETGLYVRYLSNRMVSHTINLTDKCLKKGEKVIIFCLFDEELYTLRDYYKDCCVIYNGKITPKEKENAKNEFMNNPEIKVLIGNLNSAGVGLNLTSARVVIFNTFSFVPSDNRQGEDRVYRYGQKRDCYIFYQFFKDTYYEVMWNTVLRKELLINQVIKKEDEK